LRELIPSQMPIGTIVNSYGESAEKSGGKIWERLARWGLRRAYASIRKYQRIKHKEKPLEKLQAVHSVIKIDNPNVWLSVTTPRATVGPLELIKGHKYRAFAWVHLAKLNYVALQALKKYALKLEGKPYDYGQLLDIQIKEWFGWIPSKASFFDLGRDRKVCSVACHGALLAAQKTLPEGSAPRPLGGQYIEITCPADFEVAQDFVKIAEVN